MLVDFEAVVLDIEEYIASKRGLGQRELLLRIVELKQKHRMPEGLPEQALRMYGTEIFEAAKRTSAGADGDPSADSRSVPLLNSQTRHHES